MKAFSKEQMQWENLKQTQPHAVTGLSRKKLQRSVQIFLCLWCMRVFVCMHKFADMSADAYMQSVSSEIRGPAWVTVLVFCLAWGRSLRWFLWHMPGYLVLLLPEFLLSPLPSGYGSAGMDYLIFYMDFGNLSSVLYPFMTNTLPTDCLLQPV